MHAYACRRPPGGAALMLLSLQEDSETSEFALDGLKQVMAVKSRSVLPYLVPKVSPPHHL